MQTSFPTILLVYCLFSPTLIYANCGFPGESKDSTVWIDGQRVQPNRTTTYPVGSIALYVCPDRYRLSGIDLRSCEDTGSWNGTSPQCLRNVANSAIFKTEDLLVDGLVSTCTSWMTRSSVLTFQLVQAHRIDGVRFITRVENKKSVNSSKWRLLATDDQGIVQEPFTLDASSCNFLEHDNSLERDGAFSSFYCSVNRTWSSINLTLDSPYHVPLCEIDIFAYQDECGYPEVPVNGHVYWEESEATAVFLCSAGYRRDTDEPVRKCVEGRWSGPEPACPTADDCFDAAPVVFCVFFALASLSLAATGFYVRTNFHLVPKSRVRYHSATTPFAGEDVQFSGGFVSVQ